MQKLPTQPPPGMRDFLASDMIRREYVINKVRSVFERFGFDPWETPAVERFEVLQGKYGEEEKLIYKFQDLGGRWLALRYDLTVPLARVVARFPQLPKPIKRYQISRVWRYERKQRGRYKEFWQCDVDIVGSKSMLADAEIIAVIYEVMKELGFEKFIIRINNRKLLDGLVRYVGVKEENVIQAFRAIDKLDKIGEDGVREELLKRGIARESTEKIMKIIRIRGGSEVLDEVERFVKDKVGMEGIRELREIFSYLDFFKIRRKFLVVDLSLVRGLDYYTGPIYETVVKKPRIGSLTGGGRYDKLIGMFTGIDIPATGTSFGIERIIDAMNELGMLRGLKKTCTKVFVAYTSRDLIKNCVKLASELRANGISCQIDLKDRNLERQLKYADRVGIPFVVIVGEKELKENVLTVKDMEKKKEFKVKKSELVEFLRDRI